MKKVKKWRYYCDYCKKSGASEYHMRNHEKKCTSNPDRICGICDVARFTQQSSEKLKEAYKHGGLKELRELSDNCPVCILATLKASMTPEEVFERYEKEFDYNKELEEFWQEHNSEENQFNREHY